jgi:MoaA/NifB/PqqE/SkfB family radical SAM enzyme
MRPADYFHLFLQGGPGLVQIAVTNACNARCRFCSFPLVPAGDTVMADPVRLLQGLASLRRRGSCYVTFTGGEPLLYPHLLRALAQARDLGLRTILITNGALLTPRLLKELQKAGLDCLIVSIDAASAARHDEHRGLSGLTAHIQDLLPLARQAGLHPIASVTLSRLIDDLEALLRFVKTLGFERLTFSYPLTGLQSSYLGYAAHDLVNYSPQELDQMFGQILALKPHAPLTILNSRQALLDLKRRLRRQPRRFPCLAGSKHFFVDWHLAVYRCHFLPHTLGPLEEIHRAPARRDGCDACAIECYRDASVFQYAAMSLADSLAAWRRGEWLKGLFTLFHPYNFLSLTDLLHGRQWVRH